MLRADSVKPVAAAEGVAVAWIDTFRREPVGALPAQLGTEDGAARLEARVERRDDARPAAFVFFKRESDGVVLAVGLERALAGPGAVLVQPGEAADVHGPQIHRLFAGRHPLGQHPTGAPGRGNAESVEPGTDEEAAQFRRLAEDEVAVGRERFRPVDHLLDAGGFQSRKPGKSGFHVLLEVIPVVVEKTEGEIVGISAGFARWHPGDRVRLVAAEGEPADLLLEIGAPVGIADRRHAGCDAGDRFGDHVLMLHRLERHGDASHRGDLARPQAGAEHHLVAADIAGAGAHAGHAAIRDRKACAGDAFDDPRAMHARASRQRLRDIGRARLAVGRHEGGADQIVDIDQRPHCLGLGRRQQMHVEAEGARCRRLTAELGPAFVVAGEPQAPGLAPAGGEAGLRLKPPVEAGGITQDLRDRRRRAQLTDEAGGMPRRAASQRAAFDENDVGLVVAGEMIGGGTTDDAAADDHDFGLRRQAPRHAWATR